MREDLPVYSIKVLFRKTGEEWILNSDVELACNLEYHDSDKDHGDITVTDSLNREVAVKIEGLEVVSIRIRS